MRESQICHRSGIKFILIFGVFLFSFCLVGYAVAQTVEEQKSAAQNKGRIFLTKKEILQGARKEGMVVVVPGFDRSNFRNMVKAFEKRYPFIKVEMREVSGVAGQRFHFSLASGTAGIDVFSPSLRRWSDYEKYNILGKYDFRGMVQAGELKIPPEMIDDAAPVPGLFGYFGSKSDVIVYNSQMVKQEEAPTGWESCTDPKWKGKFSVDTRYHGIRYLTAAWPEEKVMSFARKIRQNDPIWVQGVTATINRVMAGEIHWMCSAFLHSTLRIINSAPTAPIKIVFPKPTVVTLMEEEAIYAKAEHPHAGLLWMEWMGSLEAQEALSKRDPGKASFLVKGTTLNRLLGDPKIETVVCKGECLMKAEDLRNRIAVDAWGFPAVKRRR